MNRKYISVVILCFIFFFCLILWEYSIQSQIHSELQVSFLDVSQGDAIFIQTPNGTQILVDAGAQGAILSPLQKVMPQGDKTLDMVVMTHPDADHIGGFADVFAEYTITTALVSGADGTSTLYRELRQILEKKHVKQIVAYTDTTILLDDVQQITLDILFPDQSVKQWETNEGSIISRLVYGNTSVLLMADAPVETEKILVATYGERLVSDILKVGHHGSNTSTSELFLDTVSPQVAIISAGLNNRYGHPHQEVMERLIERGIEIRETSVDQTITYFSDGRLWRE